MSLFLAIDAGGTKTECLLADETRVLGRASTGSVKLMRVSEEAATGRMLAMLEAVAEQAQVDLGQVTRTCFGLAGYSSPKARAWARQIVPEVVGGEFLLCGDEEIALDAAFAGGPGILVIAGTGSNIVGRNAAGTMFRAGGWGPVLGDEGSGYWIGLEAIRAALKAQDRLPLGAKPTCLLREIQSYWELGSLDELVALANGRPGPDFAALTPVVAHCAAQGDALAGAILRQAGEDLAAQVAVVGAQMKAAGGDESPGVAFTGSVLGRIDAVRAAMVARLAETMPGSRVQDGPVDSLDGALWRARRGGGATAGAALATPDHAVPDPALRR